MEKPLRMGEAAEYLRISVSQLSKLISRGKVKFTCPGGKIKYFRKVDLDEYLNSNARKPKVLIIN